MKKSKESLLVRFVAVSSAENALNRHGLGIRQQLAHALRLLRSARTGQLCSGGEL